MRVYYYASRHTQHRQSQQNPAQRERENKRERTKRREGIMIIIIHHVSMENFRHGYTLVADRNQLKQIFKAINFGSATKSEISINKCLEYSISRNQLMSDFQKLNSHVSIICTLVGQPCKRFN